MGKPTKLPRWSDQVPANNIEPSEEKKNTGWVPAEKPPAQFMNWLQNKFYEWSKYLLARADMQQHITVRSNSTVTWDGAQLTFGSDIQLIFREGDDVITNTIPLANSPVTLADGEVLVLKKDNTSTPVPLVFQAAYANLDVGEFSIVAEGSLSDDDPESELVLFRRRGSDLEMPVFGKIYQGGDTLNFGQIETHNHQSNAEGGTIDHGLALTGLGDDDHPQYAGISQSETISGSWSFSNVVSGQTPTSSSHLATKGYVDSASISDHGSLSGLGDDDHAQYLHLNKTGQTLSQSLTCAGGVEIDGVNISTHTHDVSINMSVSRSDRANYNNSSSSDDTYTISGYDSSDFAICAITNIALHNNNFSSDNTVMIGSTTISTLSGYDWLGYPNYSGSDWNFRVITSAGNDDQIAAFFYGVMSDDDTDTSGAPN